MFKNIGSIAKQNRKRETIEKSLERWGNRKWCALHVEFVGQSEEESTQYEIDCISK